MLANFSLLYAVLNRFLALIKYDTNVVLWDRDNTTYKSFIMYVLHVETSDSYQAKPHQRS